MQDSLGQILALAFRQESLKPCNAKDLFGGEVILVLGGRCITQLKALGPSTRVKKKRREAL